MQDTKVMSHTKSCLEFARQNFETKGFSADGTKKKKKMLPQSSINCTVGSQSREHHPHSEAWWW